MFLQMMRASIRRSIVLLGLVGAASTALVAAEGAWRKEQMRQQATLAFDAKDVVADILPPPMYLVEMRLLVSQFLEGSVDRPTAKQRFEALASSYEQRAQFWRSHPPHGLERLLLGPQHDTARQFMDAVRSRLIDAPDIDPAARARELAALHQLYEQHRLAVDRTVEEANRFAEQAIGTLEAEQAQSAIIAMTVLVAAFALVAIGSQRVYRGVQQPLQGCAALARRLATGDLRRSDDAGELRHDVIGEMQRSLEDMRQRWVRIVGTVAGSAEGVATASQQIARANLDLSARTEKQASALQETSATMEQLGAMVRSSAEHAGRADQLAAEASDIAAHGGSSVGQVVQTMRGIDGRSQQIASIVKIIDDLAFQTNILALNAAVEAARAGEHGRGFAVVAAEVRALAQRSASSAHEIGELISASVDHTREGAALADTAGETMGRIVESIRRVSDTISQISGTGREQSLGVGQVVEAVHQIDHATQQNAALVEETAAAADSLRAQADQLVQAVGVFRFDRSEVESARVSEAAAVA